jgi:hypothetical protein
MVRAGPICVDKYEATVWSKPPAPGNGKPRGTQFGAVGDNYPCSDNGNDCSGANAIYAASLPSGTADQHVFGFSMAGFVSDHTRQLALNVESVPEPSLLVVTVLGVLGLAWRERRWRRS